MRIECTRQGNVVILRPRGLLAGTDADALKTQLDNVLSDGQTQTVLDCSSILFVDSHGLEVLVEVAESTIRDGRTLKLAGANPTLQEVLELTDVAALFEQCPDVKAAVGSYQ